MFAEAQHRVAAGLLALLLLVGAPARPEARRPARALEQQPGACGKTHIKQQCTEPGCIWCANQYSPWPGSDGVCIEEDQAHILPSSYKCRKQPPSTPGADEAAAHTPAAAAAVAVVAAAGGAQETAALQQSPGPSQPSCAVLHFQADCHRQGCVWCSNRFSPVPGSNGVCIEPQHVPELSHWVYKCRQHRQAVAAA